MKHLLFYVIAFPLLLSMEQSLCYSQEIFKKKPLNDETLQDFETYIRKFAPADSAYKVLNYLINSYINLKKSILSYSFWKKFNSLFPIRKKELDNRMQGIQELVIFYSAKPEEYELYEDFIRTFAPEENAFVALQRRIDNYLNFRKWDSAKLILNKFKPLFPNKKTFIDKIIQILDTPPQNLTVRNLGPAINSDKDEWDPCPTPDGKYIFFSTRNRPEGYGNTDVFFSKNINGIWQKAENLGPSVNGKNDETIDNVTVDGNGLLLSGTFEGTFGQFDIYYIQRNENSWETLEHFPYPINTKYVDEGACFSSDGKVLVFTSDRPGGVGEFHPYGTLYHGNQMGNMDIYVCFKTDTGWSQPINLGTQINTPFAERSPYLHPDGRTLYFSSDGHPGLGKLDVFKAVRLREDSWTEWSEPINLGKEINTILDDWGYKISLKGDSAFFAGHWRTDGFGGWDLYSVALPGYAKPQKFATITGRIQDPTGKLITAKVKFEDLSKSTTIGTLRSNPEDGSYIIILPLGKNYGYFIEKDGYFPSSNNIDLTTITQDTTIVYNIILYPLEFLLEKKKKVQLNNIFFDFDKYVLKPESFSELDRIVKILKDNPSFNIHIEGHTDSIGTEEYNMQLSKKRAEAVRNYLIENGIQKHRIVVFAFGSSVPVASNDSDEGRALNRRVEIWFVRR